MERFWITNHFSLQVDYILSCMPLLTSPNIISMIRCKRVEWAGHVTRMGRTRYIRKVLVGKPEGKKQLGRPRHRWKGNVKVDLKET